MAPVPLVQIRAFISTGGVSKYVCKRKLCRGSNGDGIIERVLDNSMTFSRECVHWLAALSGRLIISFKIVFETSQI